MDPELASGRPVRPMPGRALETGPICRMAIADEPRADARALAGRAASETASEEGGWLGSGSPRPRSCPRLGMRGSGPRDGRPTGVRA